MKSARVFLLLAAVSAPLAARAFDVTLVQPSRGQELAAGSTSVVEWNAADAPANVEEWEAFVSIDGGRTYALRITPHLDTSIHRFQWTVPDLPGAELTLMLRFGDERDEHAFVFDQYARIRGIASPLSMLLRPPAVVAAERGEDGAVSWIEGKRDGSALREVSVAGSALAVPARATSHHDPAPVAAAIAGHATILRHATPMPLPRPLRREAPRAFDTGRDVLLLSTRLNV